MNKIAIFSHMPQRDRHFDEFLYHELKKRGQAVWLLQYLQKDFEYLTTIKPDVVVVPEIRIEYGRDMAWQLKQYGCQVIVRCCEVGITEESIPSITDDYRRAIFGNWPMNECLDQMWVWGPRMAKVVAEHGSVDSTKIKEIGSAPFGQYFVPPPPKLKRPSDKPIVLFATGFAYADRNREHSMPEAFEGEDIHTKIIDMDSAGRSKWLGMLPKFVERFKDRWHIQVKAHVGERKEAYLHIVKDTVQYVNDISGFCALQQVDCVVHAGSTMAYEAHLLGKPAFNVHNVCMDVIVSKVSPNFTDNDKFFEAFNKVEIGKSNADMGIIETLEGYYGQPDGEAYIRAADLVCGLPQKKSNIPDEWPPWKIPKYKTKDVVTHAYGWGCSGCGNKYLVLKKREMVKCPYCGVGNVLANDADRVKMMGAST